MIEVFSSGGGTQSCCIAVMILKGELPRPDFTVIADTGREMPTTWEYLENIVIPAFSKSGLAIHRIKASEYASPWGKGLFATSGHLMVPAYSNINGEASKLSAYCSGAWKAETVDRWFSITQKITRSKYRKWIGFSCDETKRVNRMSAGKEFKSGLIRFPLVEKFIRREEAIQIVIGYGWPEPPRSRCFDCPNQSDLEWLEVKENHPPLFESAIERDQFIRTRDAHAFLHSSITPLKPPSFQRRIYSARGAQKGSVLYDHPTPLNQPQTRMVQPHGGTRFDGDARARVLRG